MKKRLPKLLKKLRPTVKLLFSALLLAFSVGSFVLPHKLVAGGLSGISLILNAFLPLSESVWVALLSALFFVLGFFVFGVQFVLRTAFFSVVYPLFLLLFSVALPTFSIGAVPSSVLGGAIGGLSLYLAFSVGGSTGGVDVLAIIISRRVGISISRAVFFVDISVILLGALVYRDPRLTALGALCALVGSLSLAIFKKIF